MENKNVVKRIVRVMGSQMLLAEYARQTHVVVPSIGVTLEDVLKPQAWGHVAKQLKKGDHLEITAADGSWYAELLVRGANNLDIHLGVLMAKEFKEAEEKSLKDYEAVYVNNTLRWRVVRLVDKAIMTEGLASKAAALGWIQSPPSFEPLRLANAA